MKNILQFFFLLSILSTLLVADKKVRLQLNWLHQFQSAGYYVAKEKGFYKDVGLDVEIKEFQSGLDLSSSIENGEADFVIGRSSLLVDRSIGKDVVALSAMYQQSPLILLVTKKSGIESIEDLRDKSIMITADAKASAPIIAMLKSKGIGLNDVKVEKHTFNLDDLVDGKTDAMAAYISNEPIRLDDRNIDYKIFNPKHYGFEFYDDMLFTSSSFIKKNPELSKDFYDATLRGWRYAFTHIGETAEIIYEKYNSQNRTLIQLVKEGEVLKTLAYDNSDDKIGCLDKERLDKMIDVYKVLGLISNEVDLDAFIYEHNVHDIYKISLSNRDIIMLFILSLLSFLLIFYILIKKRYLLTNKMLKQSLHALREKMLTQTQIIENQYNQLHSIINKSDEIIILKDENLNYMECNDCFAKLFDKTRDEIMGKNVFYLFDEETANHINDMDYKALHSEEEITLTQWVKFPAVEEKQFVKIHFHRFKYDVNKTGLLIFARDTKQNNPNEQEDVKA